MSLFKKDFFVLILCVSFMNIEINAKIVKNNQDIKVTQGEKMNKSDQKISEKVLNELLASESVLLFQTLNYHWNLTGPEFHDYHLLFDKQYNALFEDMDKIAERVRAVQGAALGSMKEMSVASHLKEDTGKTPIPSQMIKNLLKQYEALIAQIHENIELLEKKTSDFGTRNFLEELITKHEKTAWMLRSLNVR